MYGEKERRDFKEEQGDRDGEMERAPPLSRERGRGRGRGREREKVTRVNLLRD